MRRQFPLAKTEEKISTTSVWLHSSGAHAQPADLEGAWSRVRGPRCRNGRVRAARSARVRPCGTVPSVAQRSSRAERAANLGRFWPQNRPNLARNGRKMLGIAQNLLFLVLLDISSRGGAKISRKNHCFVPEKRTRSARKRSRKLSDFAPLCSFFHQSSGKIIRKSCSLRNLLPRLRNEPAGERQQSAGGNSKFQPHAAARTHYRLSFEKLGLRSCRSIWIDVDQFGLGERGA